MHQVKCPRCGSFYVNRKVKSNPLTSTLAYIIAALTVWIGVHWFASANNLGYFASLLIVVFLFGIVVIPVVFLSSMWLASRLAPSSIVAACHKCGLSWDEKRAVPTTAPAQSRRNSPPAGR